MTDDRNRRIPAALRWAGRGIRLSLRSHPLTSSLALLVACVTAGAMAWGSVRIQGSDSGAVSDQHVDSLVRLASAATNLAESMEDEADDFAVYIAQGRPDTLGALLISQGQAQITNQDANDVSAAARGIGAGYPAQVRAALVVVRSRLQDLTAFSQDAESTQTPALEIIQDYTGAISDILALDEQAASGTGDPTLGSDVRALSALAQAEDEAAQQRAILDAALTANQFQDGDQPALSGAFELEQADLSNFDSEATIAQQHDYQNRVSGPDVDNAGQMLQQALVGGPNAPLNVTNPPGSPFASALSSWHNDMTYTLGQMRAVEHDLLAATAARGQALHAQATDTALDTWLEMLGVVLAVVAFAVVVTRRSRSVGGGFHPAAG